MHAVKLKASLEVIFTATNSYHVQNLNLLFSIHALCHASNVT